MLGPVEALERAAEHSLWDIVGVIKGQLPACPREVAIPSPSEAECDVGEKGGGRVGCGRSRCNLLRPTCFSDGRRHGMQRTSQLDSLLNRPLSGCEIVGGGFQGSPSCRTVDTASRRGAGFVDGDFRMMPGPAASARTLGQAGSRRLFAQAFQKCLPLLSGQKLEESRHRKQQGLRISVIQVGSR